MGRTIRDRAVVITGAGSGLGREMAMVFGGRGARLVLADINERALAETAAMALEQDFTVEAMVADMADWEMVRLLADRAVDLYGRIDVWINNAAVSVYGEFVELPMVDVRRVIEVDLLGYVHGVKAAVERMRHTGGTVICITSEVARRAVPLQSPYCAAKRGVTGLLESVRVELRHAGWPVDLCEVLPVGIDTPFFEHAKTYLGVKPQPTGQVLDPRRVALAVLRCAEHPQAEVPVGGMTSALNWLDTLAPRLLDRYLAGPAYRSQYGEERRTPQAPSDLHGSPHTTDRVRGGIGGARHSPYTWALQHRGWLAGGMALGTLALMARRRGA